LHDLRKNADRHCKRLARITQVICRHAELAQAVYGKRTCQGKNSCFGPFFLGVIHFSLRLHKKIIDKPDAEESMQVFNYVGQFEFLTHSSELFQK
jgi:hypothetical protein